MLPRVAVIAGLLVAAPSPARAAEAAPVEVDVRGEALHSALPRLGRLWQERLTVGESLRQQRVTLLGRGGTPAAWRRALAELLTPRADAGVFWTPTADGFRLEESRGRQLFARRLSEAEAEEYRQFLDQQAAWARGPGLEQLPKLEGLPQRMLRTRVVLGALLDVLGAEGRARLVGGEPMPVRFSALRAPPYETVFAEWMAVSNPVYAAKSRDYQDRCWFVLTYERDANRTRGGTVVWGKVHPSGFLSSIGHAGELWMRRPGPSQPVGVAALRQLGEPVPNEKPGGRRVTFQVTPSASPAAPAAPAPRHLHQVLAALSADLGLTIVADGYLRPSLMLPPGLEARDVPLDRLLTRIAQAWGCEWRYAEKAPGIILMRSRRWWIEDAADVPQGQVDDLVRRMGARRPAALEDLLLLARLSEPQVRKLVVETGLLPGADGVVSPFECDLGMRACLEFLGRLPAPLRQEALADGVPLTRCDPQLVQRVLGRTLVGFVGAVTPEMQQRLWFRFGPVPPRSGSPGWRVSIWTPPDHPDGPGSNWYQEIRVHPPRSPEPAR
jgi:hypothetical protein